ncbi:VanZ family protein [Streptomyces sp. NPDC052015]|uniref:VanZ family protein n=1 Tax=Streptomyces sp. NPDC052015 TaxID=3154755 RepID=UPI0034243EB0
MQRMRAGRAFLSAESRSRAGQDLPSAGSAQASRQRKVIGDPLPNAVGARRACECRHPRCQINFLPLITLDATAVPNVIMFLPLGVLLPLISQVNRVRRAAAVSALASLCVEATQLLCYVIFNNGRSCDINDVLANELGGMIGYAVVHATLNGRASGSLLRAIALPGSSARAQVTSVRSACPATSVTTRCSAGQGTVPRRWLVND